MKTNSFDERFKKAQSRHDKIFKLFMIVFVMALVLTLGYYALVAYLMFGIADYFVQGYGLRDIIELVWCGANSGSCIK